MTDTDVLSKQEYVKLGDSEVVTSILTDNLQRSKEIWAATRSAAYLVGEGGKLMRRISFSSASSDVQVFTVPNSREVHFLNRGGLTSDLLYDSEGKLVWRISDGKWSRSSAVGDINNDGLVEYIVAEEDRLSAYSQERVLLWSKRNEELVWHIEIGDLEGDGRKSVINSNREGILVIRDRDGNIRRKIDSMGYVGDFSTVLAPTSARMKYLVVSRAAEVLVIDRHGLVIAKYSAPGVKSNRIVATYFSGRNGKTLFAAIVDIKATWKRSKLFVWDQERSLVFEEILPYAGGSIASYADSTVEEEALLVGGAGRIWKYIVTADFH